jgi:ribulose-5-phosphate 4-epimerase/fuculose-1-phosphate aldolase
MNQLRTDFKIDRSLISDPEWELRTELACAYRLVDHFGWTELIYGHLTARVPGPKAQFLINPYGLNYDEVTASNLVKIDVDGNKIDDTPFEVNYAGFVIHSAVHMMPDTANHVVMHTHTRAGMAIAAIQEGLLPVSMGSTTFFDNIAYHEYEGPSLYLDERERLVASLGAKKAMILKNHGLLTTGKTVAEAFLRLYRLERACQVQIDAAAAGTLNIMGDNMAAKSGADVERFADNDEDGFGYGELEFAALMRKMDKKDPGYRD